MSPANPQDPTRFNTKEKPNWCPGCGNFGLQAAMKKALLTLGLQPHEAVIVAGIGCSGKLPEWVHVCAIHGLHGRTLPLAQGAKLANPRLTVFAEGGDGDGYSEGMSHFIHAARRNVDLTYIVHNNGVFALTTGQASATQEEGFVSPSTPHGATEPPISPLALAIATGATFVARGYSGDMEHLKDLYVAAVRHHGFALVDVFQVCVTYNPSHSYKWYKDRIYKLGGEHDPTDRDAALRLALNLGTDRLPIGILYRAKRPAFEDHLPQAAQTPLVDHDIQNINIAHLMEEMIPRAPRGASEEGADRIVGTRHVPPEAQGKEPTIEKVKEDQ